MHALISSMKERAGMRLLYVANSRMPTEKAHGWQIAKMCEAFADAGASVTLFVPRRKNPIRADIFSYYGVRQNFSVRYLACIDSVSYGTWGFYLQSATFTLSALCRAFFFRKDITYSRDEVFSFAASMYTKRLYYEMHDYPRRFRSLYRSLFRRAAGIVSTNRIKRVRLEREFNIPDSRIIVAPNGIDLSAFEHLLSREKLRQARALPPDRSIICYAGKFRTFGEGKGVEELVKAFAQLRARDKRLFLLLVGINATEKAEVLSLLALHGIDSASARIVLHVPHSEIPSYLSLSDILVMNYPDTEHYREFMNPIKMFEYMASGAAIVASDLASIREVLHDQNAVFVRPGDMHALTDGISLLLRDQGRAHALADRARSDVAAYQWKGRAALLLSFMQKQI